MDKITWKNERRKVKDLVPAEYNPRVLTEKARADLLASISEFSEVEPVVINTTNRLIGGHQRTTIYADLGIEEIDVRVPSRQLSLEEEMRLNLRLNKNVADWDAEKLAELDMELLADVGWSREDLSEIMDEIGTTNRPFDETKAVEKARTEVRAETGQVYQLGKHRLMCGDSMEEAQVRTLVGDRIIDMVYCDPPYNIGLDYSKGVGGKEKYGGSYSSKHDSKADRDYMAFVKATLASAVAVAGQNAHFFYWCDQRYIWVFQQIYKELGIENKRVLLWIKERANPVPAVAFNKVYEPCVYGVRGRPFLNPNARDLTEILNNSVGGGKKAIEDILDIIDLWIVPRDSSSDYAHPTQKPVALHERPIRRCTPPGAAILDLFGGSGSTLMACEDMKRSAFLMEQDPVFATVILNRWEAATGEKAQKLI